MDFNNVPPPVKTYNLQQWTSLKPAPLVRQIRPGAYGGNYGGNAERGEGRARGVNHNQQSSRFQQPGGFNHRGKDQWNGLRQVAPELHQPGTSKEQLIQPWWVKAQKLHQQPGNSRQGPWRWKGRGGGGGQTNHGKQPQQRLMAGQRWSPRFVDGLLGEDEERQHRPYGFGSDDESDNDNDCSGSFADWRNYGATRKQKLLSQYQDNVEFHHFVVELLKRNPIKLIEFRALLHDDKRPEAGSSYCQPIPEKTPFENIDEVVCKLIDELMFSPEDDPIRKLFVGVCIYVNGYTYPTADVLMHLMQLSGGEFTWSFDTARTTHTVSTVLSMAQKKREKALLTTVRPDWVLDSFKARKLLHVHEYKVIKPKNDIKKMFERIITRQQEERQKALIDAEMSLNRIPMLETKPQAENNFITETKCELKTKLKPKVFQTISGEKSVDMLDLMALYSPDELDNLFEPFIDEVGLEQLITSEKNANRNTRSSFRPITPSSKQTPTKVSQLSTSPELIDFLNFLTPPKLTNKQTAISTPCLSPELFMDEMRRMGEEISPIQKLPSSIEPLDDLLFNVKSPPNEQLKPNLTTTVVRVADDELLSQSETSDHIKVQKRIKSSAAVNIRNPTTELNKNVNVSNTTSLVSKVTNTVNTKPSTTTKIITHESVNKPQESLLKINPRTGSTKLILPTYTRNKIQNAGLPPSKLRSNARPDDKHYVEVEPYIPSSMNGVDQAVLAELPEDIKREITGYIRQKSANTGKPVVRTIPGNIVITSDPNDPKIARITAARRAEITKQETSKLFASNVAANVRGKAMASKQPKFANARVAGRNQLRLDTMFIKAKQEAEEKAFEMALTVPERNSLQIYYGALDEKLGPNICGLTRLKSVLKLLREWILTEANLTDDDVSYLLKYFAGLVDTNKHDQLLQILWKMKNIILVREAKGGLECATWKTLFYETFPAFLTAEPTFKSKIPRKLFWFAKERSDDETSRPSTSKRLRTT